MRVTGDDWARLGDAAEHAAHLLEHRAFMRMAGGHCAALEVRRGPDGAQDFFCTLYDRRPQICRDLARGSPECAGERARKDAPAIAGVAQGRLPVSTTSNTAGAPAGKIGESCSNSMNGSRPPR